MLAQIAQLVVLASLALRSGVADLDTVIGQHSFSEISHEPFYYYLNTADLSGKIGSFH